MELGIKNEEKLTVTEKDTAKTYKSGTLDVFATPAMIALMEKTAMDCVAPYLEDGQATVGTLMNVAHTAASPIGAEIVCKCELVEIDRRKLVFEVSAFDNAGEIGKGRHERFIIDTEKFMDKANAKLLSDRS